MPVFPAIFERVAGNLLSVDGSATQLPAILRLVIEKSPDGATMITSPKFKTFKKQSTLYQCHC